MRRKKLTFSLLALFLFFVLTSVYVQNSKSQQRGDNKALPFVHANLNADIIDLAHHINSATTKEIVSVSIKNSQPVNQNDLKTCSHRNEFEAILATDCNASKKHSTATCWKRVQDLHANITTKQAQARFDKCNDCIYSTETGKKVYFYHHTFWHINVKLRPGGHFGAAAFQKQVLNLQILSFLATQNLCCTKFIVWRSEFNEVDDAIRNKFAFYIQNGSLMLKRFDLEEICRHDDAATDGLYSSFKQHPICTEKHGYVPRDYISFSDFVRFIVLDLYGGIYLGNKS
jgi:hypothetical protein